MNEQIEIIRGVAAHDVEIKHLQDDMDKLVKEMAEIKNSLAEINKTLSEARGGWKTLMWVGGASATIGAFAGWVIDHIGK